MNHHGPDERTLESWKEIAAYLQRDAKTARNWEKNEGLPVHRHSHKSRSSVYAYPKEIDAWRAGRRVVAEPAAASRPWWRPVAVGATTLLCLIMVGNGVRPASAQQSEGERMRQIPFESGLESPSPDGRYLTFTDWKTGDLAVRDLTTGAKRRLTDEGVGVASGYADSAMISPDGRLVAYPFVDQTHDRYDLRLAPFSGTNIRDPKILHHSDDTKYLFLGGWTPDSKSILIIRQLKDQTSQIAMVSVEDGSLRMLKSFAWRTLGSATLSPDGRHIAYSGAASDTDWDIFALASDGSSEGKLTEGPANDSWPLWSPDGSQVVFFSDRTGASQSMWTVAVRDGKAAGPARLLKSDFGSGRFLPRPLTRNGELYFSTGCCATDVYGAQFNADMEILKPPAPVTQRFVDSTGGGSWSPDGKSLAYYLFRSPSQTIPGGTDLVIRTIATGAERLLHMPQIAVPPYIYTPPARWFPDGRSVMVVSYPSQRPGIGFYRVDLASGSAKLLETVPDAGPPDLSPDGKTIFYRTGSASSGMRLVSFSLDAKRETELKHIPVGKSFTPVAVSPDGKQLAYGVMDNPTGTAAAMSSLEVMPASGGEARQVFRGKMGPLAVTWSRDQKYLLFQQPGPALYRVPLAGGEPEKTGIMRGVFFPQIHPDGRRVVFGSGGEGKQQFWVLENFLPKAPEAYR
ncbi:MAG TPA: hypothetical protein VH639_24505 [Bryobacteraceae bacterium]